MSNKSKELNGCLRDVVERMKENLCVVLREKGRVIHTDRDGCDEMYGYLYDDCDDKALKELQVKGITLIDGEIYVCLDYDFIKYTREDLMDEEKCPDELWYNLFHSDVLAYYTMISINESIHQYL